MQLLNRTKLRSSKEQIAIKSVTDDVLVLPDGRYRSVIETSSINFELKSDAEQDALIDTYQSFLNGLGCPIQIIVRAREIDLDNYLFEMESLSQKEEKLIYKQQLADYAVFIRGLVNVNKILSRSFYVVVPFDIADKHDFDYAREQLAQRTDIIIKGLERLGMHTKLLTGLDILNLFHVFYNPKQAKTQPLTSSALRLMHFALIKEAT